MCGVNDSIDVLIILSEILFDVGVLFYYLYVFDLVEGVYYFDVFDDEVWELVWELFGELSGFLVLKLVWEVLG